MPSLSAESYFKKGLAALVENNPQGASALFRQALDLDRERNKRDPDMRYLSYYGLSLAQAGLSTTLALRACKTAASRERHHPVHLLNLGRVYALAGKTTLALDAFERGLLIVPDHRVLQQERASLDRRATPVIPLLSRNHPLNCMLGRWRASRRRRTGSGPVGSRSVTVSRS